MQFSEIDGLRIRFAIHSTGFTENVLFLNPLPESILAFTPVWDELARHYNILAIDLPGFGHSQGRSELNGSEAMATFVSTIIDHFSFAPAHIIGPDIGTPIALFVAAKFSKKVKSLIVSAGACMYPLEVGALIHDLISAPDLSGFRGLTAKDAVNGSLNTLKNHIVPDDIRADYIASYEADGRLMDAFQFLRNYAVNLPVLDTFLDGITLPVKIIWGRHDDVAPVRNAELLHERLAHSELTIFENGGHYIWEDNSEEYLASLLGWLREGYARFYSKQFS